MTDAAGEHLDARRPRSSIETKKRLLDAAEEEFAAKGFDGARLGNIAKVSGVQQALIHHYFEDKAGLYREVVTRALAAMTDEGWDILGRFAPKKKKMTRDDLRQLCEAFADLLVRFYSQHASLFSLLRHEAQRSHTPGEEPSFVDAAMRTVVRPQFDEIVSRLEAMQRRGDVRADVDARHLCISAVAMACFPFQEEHFLAAVWPVDVKSARFLEERKREIVQMLLSRALP